MALCYNGISCTIYTIHVDCSISTFCSPKIEKCKMYESIK